MQDPNITVEDFPFFDDISKSVEASEQEKVSQALAKMNADERQQAFTKNALELADDLAKITKNFGFGNKRWLHYR